MVQLRSGGGGWRLGDVGVTPVGIDVAVTEVPRAATSRGAEDLPLLEEALAQAGLVERSRLAVEVLRVERVDRGGGEAAGAPSAEGGFLQVEVPRAGEGEAHLLLLDDGGALRWELPTTPRARSATAPQLFEVWLPSSPPAADHRGLAGAVAKRVLRVLAFKVVDEVLGPIGDFFVRRWEDRHRPYRLRSFSPGDYRHPDVPAIAPEAVAAMAAGGPTLLLVHGTSSLSHSGFGLLPESAVRGFADRYANRVLAFDHPTLSVDPRANAEWLVRHLPPGAGLEVDVLCHSRGGLVARVLSERPGQVGLDPATLHVRSITFVATPNAGTALCDRRHLSRFVDAFTNLLDLVPDNPVVDALNCLIEMLKQLAVGAYGGLDGAMAMDPRSDFLEWLNQPSAGPARYRAIASDYEPPPQAPAARAFRDELLDRVFGVPNDLIVPTASVYSWNGATGFPVRERIVLPRRRSVDHSTFWTAEEVLTAFDAWLRPEPSPAMTSPLGVLTGREPADHADLAFAEVDERLAAGDVAGVREALRELPDDRRRELGEALGGVSLEGLVRGEKEEDLGTVVLLHGIMGSNLFAVADGDADRIWVSPLRLANGEFRRLALPGGSERIEARGLYRGYLALLLWLDRHWKVVPFAFDWRASLSDSAEKLAAALDEAVTGPAHLVAHSMGGLVARTMTRLRPDVWARLDDPGERRRGGRLVMLGTPNHGSFAIPLAFTGKERMVKALALADFRNRIEDVQQVLAGFPGSYEMLPSAAVDPSGDHVALFEPETWGPTPVRPELLAAAREAQAALAGAVDPLRMVYVAGSGHDTPHRLRVNKPGDFSYTKTRAGDGRVTHERGRLDGVATFYSSANHGDLITDAGVLAAIDDLLLTGDTASLPAIPPGSVRAVAAEEERWRSPDELEARGVVGARQRGPARPETRDAEAFVADAVSDYLPPPQPEIRRALPALTLRVRHANCEAAAHPVLVGHYQGDPMAGAEAFVDRRLGGRLSARQLVGLYPDELGEHLLMPAMSGQRPPGTIVMGLGPRGELTPSRLTQGVTDVVLAHALSVADAAEAGGGTASASFSAVLVGTSGADGLSVESSVLAIAEGTMAAIQVLAEHPSGTRVSIDEIEFVEMYAQRAARAAYAVREIRRFVSPDRLAYVDLRPAQRLDRGEGARPGDVPLEYEAGSWRRLVVTARDPDAATKGDVDLVFTSMGLQARADQLTQRVDGKLLQLLLADAMRTTPGAERVNRALYELLLPPDLKHDLSTVENLHLVVDERTGDYPWELLADRDGPGAAEPLARRSGLLRQLSMAERRHLASPKGENTALVIGNPPGGKGYPPLPGAMHEASAVAATLAEGGFRVDSRVFDHDADPATTPSEVSVALLDGDFRVVHIAGHGNYEPGMGGAPPVGGVVIGEGVYLTAGTIAQMRRPPDLVFLNCCHLGRVGAVGVTAYEEAEARAFTSRHLNQLAASLARALMAMGVRAVVAAGWPVADDAAAAFAQALYERLLGGEAYGDAVKHARRQACKADGGASNTWAAYQCYGDPGFRLGARDGGTFRAVDPVSEEELVRALQDIAVRVGDPGSDAAELEREVRRLEGSLPPGWGRGHVLAAFGAAYGELGRFDDAVRLYRGAISAEDGTVELRAVEQLANLEVRYATDLRRQAGEGGPGDPAQVEALFVEAEGRLKHLLGLAETPERNALLAAHYKRWALTGRKEHLAKAIDHYLRAGMAYTRLNALQLATVSGVELGDELSVRVEECKTWLEGYEPETAAADYWERVGAVDAALTRALVGGSLSQAVDTLRHDYARVLFGDRSTPRARDSTVEHLMELAALASEPTRSALLRLGSELRRAREPVATPVTGSLSRIDHKEARWTGH